MADLPPHRYVSTSALKAGAVSEVYKTIRDTVYCYGRLGRLNLPGVSIKYNCGGSVKKRLLLLVDCFPPDLSPGVYRPLALSKYLARKGWHVTVIARSLRQQPTPAGLSLKDDIPDNVPVHRWRTLLRPSWRLFPRIDGLFTATFSVLDTAQDILKNSAHSLIVATGPQFATFPAACHLGHAFSVPVILDYRDEWTDCPFDFVQKGNADACYERRCLIAATRVVYTTKSQQSRAIERFGPALRSKSVVIPNAFEAEEHRSVHCLRTRSSGLGILLSFVGTLGMHTLPGSFLSTLSQCARNHPTLARNLRIRFVGAIAPQAEKELRQFEFNHMIHITYAVSKAMAIKSLYESDWLLILNPPNLKRYLPGKIFDYIASKRPILVFGRSGEIADIVTSLKAGQCISENATELGSWFDRAGEKVQDCPDDRIDRWMADNTRERMAERFVLEFERVS